MKSIRSTFTVPFAILAAASAPSAWDGPQSEILIPVNPTGDTPLVYGSRTVGATISNVLEVDGYPFPGLVGDIVQIGLFSVTGRLDLQCKIVDATGAQVGLINSTNGAAIVVEVTLTGTAPFKLLLDDFDKNDTGAYDVHVDRIPPLTMERVLGYGRFTTDTLDNRLDLDAFRVEMIAGLPMEVRFNGSGGRIDPFYELYDPTGSRVDFGTSTNGVAVTKPIIPNMTGTYVILISDEGLNDTGAYGVFVSCNGVCPQTASEFVRNGSGVNLIPYSVDCPAFLGGTLSLKIDATTQPAATFGVLYFYTDGTLGTSSPYGEILVDQLSPRLGKLVSPVIPDPVSGVHRAVFQVAIPADHSLAGFFTASQGLLYGGGSGVKLTNAIDITVGF